MEEFKKELIKILKEIEERGKQNETQVNNR